MATYRVREKGIGEYIDIGNILISGDLHYLVVDKGPIDVTVVIGPFPRNGTVSTTTFKLEDIRYIGKVNKREFYDVAPPLGTPGPRPGDIVVSNTMTLSVYQIADGKARCVLHYHDLSASQPKVYDYYVYELVKISQIGA